MTATGTVTLHYVRGEQSEALMGAVVIQEGWALGLDPTGYVRGLVAGDPFYGHSQEYYDNSAGAPGDWNIKRLTGRYRLQVMLASASLLDVGKPLYMSDNETYTLDPVGNSRVGLVERYVAAHTIVALFDTNGPEPLVLADDVIFGAPLAGVGHQGLHEKSTTKHYRLGTLRYKGGRKFAYARAGTAGVIPNMAAKFMAVLAIGENAHADADTGATTILIEEAGIAANAWADGYVIFHTAGGTQQNRQVIANTASQASTNHVTVTLDEPLTTAITTSTLVEIIPSPWSNLQFTTDEYASHAGWAAIPAANTEYFWCQIGGPAWNCPGGATRPGDSFQDRVVFYVGDGSINGGAHLTYAGNSYQPAGFVIEKNTEGVEGPPFVMVNGDMG